MIIMIITIAIIIIIIIISIITNGRSPSLQDLSRVASDSMSCGWCGRFPKFHRVFLGRDPGTLKSDIVSTKTSTINSFGFETLKLKIRRLKLWKPTVICCELWLQKCSEIIHTKRSCHGDLQKFNKFNKHKQYHKFKEHKTYHNKIS